MLLPLLAALAGVTPQDSAEARLAARVAGCYVLEPGPWRTDSAMARYFPPAQAPTGFRLTAEPLTGWEPLYARGPRMFAVVAQPEPGTRQTPGLFTYWSRRPGSGDTLHVSYPLAFAGIALDLVPAGPDLVGRVTSFTDAIGRDGTTEASRPVRARRVPCPGAPPAPASVRRPAQRGNGGGPALLKLSRWADRLFASAMSYRIAIGRRFRIDRSMGRLRTWACRMSEIDQTASEGEFLVAAWLPRGHEGRPA